MLNVLLDRLPTEWDGYKIDTDFQTGIQVSQCMADKEFSEQERFHTAVNLLFCDKKPPIGDAIKCVNWFLSGFVHDNHEKLKKNNKPVMDFDIDQWRIYAAFKAQYDIDLNKDRLHWFAFMGLLTNLKECAFTRVIDIRQKKIDPKMPRETKKAVIEAKKVYELSNTDEVELSMEEKELENAATEAFNRLRGKS